MFAKGNSMKAFAGLTLLLLIIVAVTETAQAQSRIRGPRQSPAISPYIELLRNNRQGGGGTAFNYFQRVRPQQRAIESRQQFSQQIGQLSRRQRSFENGVDQTLNPTGHTTSFLNLGGYYSTSRR